jgi:hypothetical protein
MLKVVMPAFLLAILAQAVLAGAAGLQVRMGTPEAVASACRLASGFQSVRLWQKFSDDDEDVYVREVFADARADVRSAVARFKAELQDRALTEAIDKQRVEFVAGRLTLAGCATVAAVDADGVEGLFPALR